MKMNWKPGFLYQLGDFIKGAGVFYLIIAVFIVSFSFLGSINRAGFFSFSGFGIIAAICLFVFGVVNPRPNLRLCVQLGISRRTAFITQLLAILVTSILLAAAVELLSGLAQVAFAHRSNMVFVDFYQLLYLGPDKITLTFSQHLASLLLNLGIMITFFTGGMFFTFLFWRLNKVWTVIVAISIPVLCNLIPLTVHRVGAVFPAFAHFENAVIAWLGYSAWNLLWFCILLSAVFVMVDWLLVRQANIKEPKSK